MYPAGLTCRVGGRPDGGKDLTCPLWRGITTHNSNVALPSTGGSSGLGNFGHSARRYCMMAGYFSRSSKPAALTENSASGIYSDPS